MGWEGLGATAVRLHCLRVRGDGMGCDRCQTSLSKG